MQKECRKYGNRKTVVDGITFDSKLEARRYSELKLLERAGEITDLQLQVKYTLIPSQKLNGKVVERAVTYTADFVYVLKSSGETVVEDTKGMKTDKYILKRKMMLYFHGIRIKEVTK